MRNTGVRAGQEVVQLYINGAVAGVTRPVQELKGFEKIALNPGETKNVGFQLTRDDLSFPDRHLGRVIEPRTTRVMVGAAADDIRLTGTFELRY